MSNDLIALVVAVALGIVVVGLGLRRNLDEVTRSGLPRYREDSEPETVPPGLSEERQGRRLFSPMQRRRAIWVYLLASACYLAFAVLSADGRLFHIIIAAAFACASLLAYLRVPPWHSRGEDRRLP